MSSESSSSNSSNNSSSEKSRRSSSSSRSRSDRSDRSDGSSSSSSSSDSSNRSNSSSNSSNSNPDSSDAGGMLAPYLLQGLVAPSGRGARTRGEEEGAEVEELPHLLHFLLLVCLCLRSSQMRRTKTRPLH